MMELLRRLLIMLREIRGRTLDEIPDIITEYDLLLEELRKVVK